MMQVVAILDKEREELKALKDRDMQEVIDEVRLEKSEEQILEETRLKLSDEDLRAIKFHNTN